MLTPRQQQMEIEKKKRKKTNPSNDNRPFEWSTIWKRKNWIFLLNYFGIAVFVDCGWFGVFVMCVCKIFGLILTPRRHFQMFFSVCNCSMLRRNRRTKYPLTLIHFPYSPTHTLMQPNQTKPNITFLDKDSKRDTQRKRESERVREWK